MKYLVQSEELLNKVIRMSEIYYGIGDEKNEATVPFDGTFAEQLKQAYAEWKAAEREYKAFCVRLHPN